MEFIPDYTLCIGDHRSLDIAKMSDDFDFQRWISDNGFEQIQHIFARHGMCTVERLTLHHPEFPKLLSDPQLKAFQSHDDSITSRITKAVMTLQRSCQEGMEKGAFSRLTSYIEKIEGLQILSATINEKYALKKERNRTKINQYVGICEENLDRKHKEITETFADLRTMLDAKEAVLLQKVDNYRKQYRRFGMQHDSEVIELDHRLSEMDGTLAEYAANLTERESYCQHKMEECNAHLSSRLCNPDREEEIAKYAEYAMVCYDDAAKLLKSRKNDLSKFMRKHIVFDINQKQLSQDNIYYITQNVEGYHRIKQHIPDFIDIGCVIEKDPHHLHSQKKDKLENMQEIPCLLEEDRQILQDMEDNAVKSVGKEK